MQMCYVPHEDVDLATGMMYTEGHSLGGRCAGRQDDATCGNGNYIRVYSICLSAMTQLCEIRRVEDSVGLRIYSYQVVLCTTRVNLLSNYSKTI